MPPRAQRPLHLLLAAALILHLATTPAYASSRASAKRSLSSRASASRASGRSSLGVQLEKKKPKGPNPEKPPQDEVRVMSAQ